METVVLRSSVLPALMRQTLWRGTSLAGFGVLTLLIGGIFLPVDQMKVYGPFLFLFGIGVISLGLLPYKRLKRLEDNPYTIAIEGEGWLHFSAKGKMLFSIPMHAIDHTRYIDKGNMYGIAVFLKSPLPEKLVVQDPNFDLGDFRKRSLKSHGCDLFLSYFSQRTYERLTGYLPE